MMKSLSFFLFSSLLISSCAALPHDQDRFFFLSNAICQQRVRAQCVTQCIGQTSTAMCTGSCGFGFGRTFGGGNTYSFQCGSIQPLATATTAAPAPDGQGPIRNDAVRAVISEDTVRAVMSDKLDEQAVVSVRSALPRDQDRFFGLSNALCQQRVRAQCVTKCIGQTSTAMCTGSCGFGFGRTFGGGNTYSFQCGSIQPLATATTAAPAPDGQGPIRNDAAIR